MTCLCAFGMLCSFLSLFFFFRSASKAPANEKKERALNTMSEASNYTGGSDYAANPSSPAGRVSDTHDNRGIIMHVCEVMETQVDYIF